MNNFYIQVEVKEINKPFLWGTFYPNAEMDLQDLMQVTQKKEKPTM